MSEIAQQKFYFKHLYGANPHEWGVVGFPKSQLPKKALKGYGPTDIVLLAITKFPDLYPEHWQGQQGKIFAACTLVSMDVKTREVANPEMVQRYPLVVQRWAQATPINELWSFHQPKDYDEFGEGELTKLASTKRGHLINLEGYPAIYGDVRTWFEAAPKDPLEVYHSERTKELLANMRQ